MTTTHSSIEVKPAARFASVDRNNTPSKHDSQFEQSGDVVSDVEIIGNIHDSAQLLESWSCDFVFFYHCELVRSY